AELLEIAAGNGQRAFARQVFTQQQTKKGGFAGAARPSQKEELTLIDGEREIAQRINAAVVKLGKVIGFYHAACASTAITCVGDVEYNMSAGRRHDLEDRDAAQPADISIESDLS